MIGVFTEGFYVVEQKVKIRPDFRPLMKIPLKKHIDFGTRELEALDANSFPGFRTHYCSTHIVVMARGREVCHSGIMGSLKSSGFIPWEALQVQLHQNSLV